MIFLKNKKMLKKKIRKNNKLFKMASKNIFMKHQNKTLNSENMKRITSKSKQSFHFPTT